MALWIMRLIACAVVTVLAIPWLVFITFLDGSLADWRGFMRERYTDAWKGRIT